MKEQKPELRTKNFEEVALGLSIDEAIREATRCLQCKKPLCVAGCPVEINIPGFIQAIKEGKFNEAVRILKEKNSLPAVCGRVCPQEDQCEKECVLGKKQTPVNIGALERFAADYEMEHPELAPPPATRAKQNKIKVGVIGAGPAGLTCAADLAKMGYEVTIFESLHKAGGVLVYGIPEFRLPKQIIEQEVNYIKSLGVDIQLNVAVGKSISLDKLRQKGFKAFFVGTGAGLPHFLGIPGENLNGVYSANEFLTRINLMKAYLFPKYDTPIKVGKHVVVIGAGNVAMDSARSALRLGAQATIVYRRTEEEMPARKDEITHAKEEGIRFELLATPKRIIGNPEHWVVGLECFRNELSDPDASGRRKPVIIPNSEFVLEVETVVCALGQGANPLFTSTVQGLKLGKENNIVADPTSGMTSLEDVFAGGDIVTGSATVIQAMGAGRRAAKTMDQYLVQKYINPNGTQTPSE